MPKRTRIQIPNAAGVMLDAVLLEPESETVAYALYAHCFTCTKEIAAAVRISRELSGLGVAVLRFDFAGLGGSGGDFARQTFSTNVLDVQAAADCLAERFTAPRLLIGHSLGGAAVLAAAGDIDSVRAVAAIGAPAEPRHVQKLFESEVEKILRDGSADVQLAGRDFTITSAFVDDACRYDLREKLARLDAALLLLHSPEDRLVSVDEAGKIFRAAKHPKSFVALDGADHLLTKPADAAYAARVIAAWSSRYIGG